MIASAKNRRIWAGPWGTMVLESDQTSSSAAVWNEMAGTWGGWNHGCAAEWRPCLKNSETELVS